MSEAIVSKSAPRITYSSKTKRKRDDAPEEDESNISDATSSHAAMSPSITPVRPGAVEGSPSVSPRMGPPNSTIKKQVVRSPISPERARKNSEVSDDTITIKKNSHFRKPSLPAGRLAPVSLSSSSGSKPMSFVGVEISKFSPRRSEIPIDGKAKERAQKRRNEAQRKQVFDDDELCEIIDPHLVRCKKCDKTIKLGQPRTYTLKAWQRHRKCCDKGANDEVVDADESEADDAGSTIAPSPSIAPSENSKKLNAAERKATLEADPRAEEVQATQVLCRKCQKWIQLRKTGIYLMGNWTNHQAKCADTSYIPSDRVAAAERRMRVVNDSQASCFTSRSVECKYCGAKVKLVGEGEYNLAQWEAHKSTCMERLPEGLSEVQRPSLPPASVTSTKETVIASDASPVSKGVKRPRESDDDERGDSEPPTNRPRSEQYNTPDGDAPGVFGWILTPFKAFARGFQEGLSAAPS